MKGKSLFLVAIFLVSLFSGMVVEEAAAELPAPRPEGSLEIWPNHIGLDPGVEKLVRFTVTNPSAAGLDKEIYQFVMTMNGTPSATFDLAQSRVVSPPGWTVREATDCDGPDWPGTAACDGLIFDNPVDTPLRPGGQITFEIAVTAANGLAYCSYMGDMDKTSTTPALRVFGLHTSESENLPGFPSITDDHPDANFIHFVIDNDVDPEAFEGDSGATGGNDFSYYVDEDHNGHIDHAYIQFSKELIGHTLDVRDFNVGRTSPDEYPVLEAEVIDPVNPDGTPRVPADPANEFCPNNSMVKLKFDEEWAYDTGETPVIKFRKKSVPSSEDPRIRHVLTGLAMESIGNSAPGGGTARVQSFQITPADRAPPVLMSAIIKLDDEDDRNNKRILFTFSERTGKTGATCDTSAPAGEENLQAMSSDDMAINPSSTNNLFAMTPTEEDIKPGFVNTNNWFWVELDKDNSSYYKIAEDDLEYRFEPVGSSNIIKLGATPHRFRTAVGADVCDENGNAIHIPPNTDDEPWEPVSPPAMVSVDGNIGFDKVTVRFTTGVNISDELKSKPHEVFDIAGGRDGPTGVIGIEHVQGSDKAIVQLDAPLTAKDVSGEPTSLRLLGGTVYAANSCKFKMIHDCTGSNAHPGWALEVQEKELIDVTPPTILYAFTRDRDSNGKVDSYELHLSEIIEDTSFTEGNPGQAGVILEVDDHLDYKRFDQGTPDDNVFTISFRPIVGDLAYDTHRLPQLNAIQQNVSGQLRGLLMDQAVNPEDVFGAGNWMLNVTDTDLVELDGALPRVMIAETLDVDENGLIDGYMLTFSEPIKDDTFDPGHWFVGPDGVYDVTGLSRDPDYDPFENDRILVIKIDEKEIDPQDPRGDTGKPMPELVYSPPSDDEGITDLAVLPTGYGPNRMLPMDADEAVERDSAPPVLMAALGCPGTPTLQVYFSEGVVAYETEDSPARGLEARDLTYRNPSGSGASGFQADSARHRAGDFRMLVELGSPITEDDYGTDRVAVQEDPKIPEFEEDRGVVTEKDGDLQTNLNEVFVAEGKDILAPDAIETISVDDDGVTAASVNITFKVPHDDGCLEKGVVDYVIKMNTTPISPVGFDQAPTVPKDVLTYTWYDEVRERNFTDTPLNLFDKRGVRENETLQLNVGGLLPLEDYYVRIAPVDRAGNIGEPSPMLTFQTLDDKTPPVKPEDWEVRSSTHKQNEPSKNAFPSFDWDAATDPESVFVTYNFAISKTSTYEVQRTDPTTGKDRNVTFDAKLVSEFTQNAESGLRPTNWYDDPAEWYFHVAACSGGGCTQLGQYKVIVDSPINVTEMRDANAKIDTTVTYDEEADTYTVEWDIPSGMPCDPAGVQIWRKDPSDAKFALLASIGAGDTAFTGSSWQDPNAENEATPQSKYLVTLRCPDQVTTYWDGTELVGALSEGAGLFPADNGPATADYDGTSAEVVEAPFRVPLWVWIVLAILGLLLVTGIVLFFVMRKSGEAELWEEGEIEEAELEAFGSADETPEGTPEPEEEKTE